MRVKVVADSVWLVAPRAEPPSEATLEAPARQPCRAIHSLATLGARIGLDPPNSKRRTPIGPREKTMDGSDQHEAGGYAAAAREHVYGFNRATMWARDQMPSEASDQLAEFADLAAALPQAFSQLSVVLEQALADQVLSMDNMTDESDPAMAVGVARLHLEEARGLAVDLHKHLNAARNATAHIISQGIDDGQESMPWDQP